MYVDEIGSGPEIVFLHGMDKAGSQAWSKQLPLARQFRLRMVHFPGYGNTPATGDQDWSRDADSVVSLLGPNRSHIVGHSYGGVVALAAALRASDKIASITLIEPALFGIALDKPAAAKFVREMSEVISSPSQDRQRFAKRALALVQPSLRLLLKFIALPRETETSLWRLKAARDMTEFQPAPDEVGGLSVPFILISGGQNAAYDDVLARLSEWTGANIIRIKGAGHSPHRRGRIFNKKIAEIFKYI